MNKNHFDSWSEDSCNTPKRDSETEMHLFDIAFILNRCFRRGIHPGAVCKAPKNISSMDAEH